MIGLDRPVIDPLSDSHAARTPAPAPTRPGPAGGLTFASVHAEAVASSGGRGLTEARLEELRRRLDPPRGERWEPVPGRSDYADVVSGPRNGFYVNLSPGPRQGQVFHIVRRDGRELHVYGEGANRRTIDVGPARAPDPERIRPREGEEFEAVPGHTRYKKIEGGPRDDLYINLSGNERTGRAFQIVERDGRRFHVYGEGRGRIEVEVGRRRAEGAQPPPAAAPGTGGAAPTGDPTAAPV
jgi:hypothetical protein